MKLEANSLIDPILLFLLSQIAVALPAIIPRDKTPRHVQPPAQVQRPAPGIEFERRLQQLRRELELAREAARAAVAEAERARDEHQAAVREADELVAQALRQQGRRRELEGEARRLEQELDRARADAGSAAQAQGPLQREIQEVSRVLKEKRSLIDDLQAQLQRSGLPGTGTEATGWVMTRSAKRPAWVEVVNNRVIPVDGDHYSTQTVLTIAGPAVVYTRRSTGETLEEARQPGSALMRFLKRQDPNKVFIACNVYADSFHTYRELRRFLRGLNYEVGWDPEERDQGRLVLGACSGNGCTAVGPQR